jgi:hypothetical protein
MDDIVKQAIARWPNVPACAGWLGLDARGRWWMRDDRAQAAGPFRGGPPEAKGSRLEHAALIAFIGRNYLPDAQGRWFFQNGPQRVFVELEAAPLVWRVDSDLRIAASHADGRAADEVRACLVDAEGRVYLETDAGFGIVHSLDMVPVGDAVERGRWTPEEVSAEDLPARFGYVRSPAAAGGTGAP